MMCNMVKIVGIGQKRNNKQSPTMKGRGKLKQKHIEDFLQDVDDFKFGEKQKMNLEQHMTPPDIAAKLLFHIYQTEPIEEYTVADIGVGTGMLMCGCIFLDANFVMGWEFDSDYIENTRTMLEEKVEGADFDLIKADIRQLKCRKLSPHRMVDLVVMNPPFGTKEAGIDIVFLEFAMLICRGNIYSMHKSSTRKFLLKFAEEKGYRMEVVMQVKFPLKKRFKGYHKKEVGFTEVDIIVLKPTKQLIVSWQASTKPITKSQQTHEVKVPEEKNEESEP